MYYMLFVENVERTGEIKKKSWETQCLSVGYPKDSETRI